MTNQQMTITEIVTALMNLSYYDGADKSRCLPNNERDQELRALLVAIPANDYVSSVSYELRFNFCFVTLIEYAKGNGCRYKIKRDLSGGYTLLCYCDNIHYETITMESFKDTETLISYLPKPHHSVMRQIKKQLERIENRSKNPSDEDRAMKEATFK